jgi:putative endonuclease
MFAAPRAVSGASQDFSPRLRGNEPIDMKRRDTGMLGERIACEFLGDNGYDIIETNYRCNEGEIDIVARQKDILVFFEVRTKKSRQFGSPEESITRIKKDRLRALAERYGQEHDDIPNSWRIDVMAIQLDRNNSVKRIQHIENAVDD